MEKAIQAAAKAQAPEVKAKQSINTVMSAVLDGENMRKRFEELLGERTPQFISSLVTMVNDDTKLQQAFYENPMSVIKSALRAASYDLPIDPGLGFAYIMPFNVSYKDIEGNWHKKMEATFVPGYKGLNQLCLRTGAYSRIPDAVDVREGELFMALLQSLCAAVMAIVVELRQDVPAGRAGIDDTVRDILPSVEGACPLTFAFSQNDFSRFSQSLSLPLLPEL